MLRTERIGPSVRGHPVVDADSSARTRTKAAARPSPATGTVRRRPDRPVARRDVHGAPEHAPGLDVSTGDAARALERLVGGRRTSRDGAITEGSLASLTGQRDTTRTGSAGAARRDERCVERLCEALERAWCGPCSCIDGAGAGAGTCPGNEAGAPDPMAPVLEVLSGVVASALGRLDPAARTLLVTRFGLAGDASRTLQQVGTPEGRGKERVRQAERRALRIFVPEVRATLDGPVGRLARLAVWASLTDGDMHAPVADLGDIERRDRLSPPLRGVFVGLGGAKALLGSADVTVDGRLARWRCEALDLAIAAAGRAGPPPAEPVPLGALCPPGWSAAQRSLYGRARGGAVHLDYLVDPARDGPWTRRAIRTDRLLRAGGAVFVHVKALAEAHERHFGPTGCDLGGYSTSLARYPTLFVEGCRHEWGSTRASLPLKPGGDVPLRDASAHDASPCIDARDHVSSSGSDDPAAHDDAGGLAASAQLRRHVERIGVMTLGEARVALPERAPNAIGRMLAIEPDLNLVRPGTARRAPATRPGSRARRRRRCSRTARRGRSAEAARSGERPGDRSPLYPAWTPDAWAALERWARAQARTHASTRDARPRPEASFTTRPERIETGHLLAIGIEGAGRPTLGRVRINRLCRARANGGLAQWVLALLGALGVVELAGDWTAPHRVRPGPMRELRDALLELRRARGVLGWDDPAHRAALGRVRDGRTGGAAGARPAWVNRPDVERFLDEVFPSR